MQKRPVAQIYLLIITFFVISAGCKKTSGTKKAIGDKDLGGIVFFTDATGLHGLVATTADISMGSPWGCYLSAITGADGMAQGTGNQNTLDIVKGCSEAGTAAKICNDLVQGGFSDWYLPSKDELDLMYQQKSILTGISALPYWSSSEVNASYAWIQDFANGAKYATTTKDFGANVRAIRSF